MTKVTLQRYLENSWLQRHQTSPQEITELLAIADRDIGQSQTLGLERRAIDFLDVCRRKRHSNVYDQVGAVSEQEADEVVAFTKTLRTQVVAWLRSNHAGLTTNT